MLTVGREDFAVDCRPSGVGVRVHTTVAVLGQASDLHIEMELDAMLRPKRVTVSGTSGGEKVADTLTFGGHTAVLRRNGQTRTIAAAPEASFVGLNFHLGVWLAIGRYDLARGGKQIVPVFPDQALSMEPLPGAPRAYRVTCRAIGCWKREGSGRRVMTRLELGPARFLAFCSG